MNLRKLNDDELMKSTDRSVDSERSATTVMLHHFREIERRRLFCAYKFGSLFEMAMKRYGYTENQANSRISAMRLLKELPELEEKIQSGALSLTHLQMARSHFRNEQKLSGKAATKEEMLELVEKMEKTSKREAQVLLQAVSSAPVQLPHDEVKPLGDGKSLYKIVAESSLEDEVKALKGFLAHKFPNLSTGELFQKLCKLGLQEWSPAREPRRKSLKNSNADSQSSFAVSPWPAKVARHEHEPRIGNQDKQDRVHASEQLQKDGAQKHLTVQSKAAVNRYIWRRDNSKCTNCGSTFAPEKDHRIPRAKGGSDEQVNFRLLCRSCNQRAAIEVFGLKHMDRYINHREL